MWHRFHAQSCFPMTLSVAVIYTSVYTHSHRHIHVPVHKHIHRLDTKVALNCKACSPAGKHKSCISLLPTRSRQPAPVSPCSAPVCPHVPGQVCACTVACVCMGWGGRTCLPSIPPCSVPMASPPLPPAQPSVGKMSLW